MTIRVHGGDFIAGSEGAIWLGSLYLKTEARRIVGEKLPLGCLASIELITQEEFSSKQFARASIGLTTRANITFAATFRDGRHLMATTDMKTFTRLQAATFNNQRATHHKRLVEYNWADFPMWAKACALAFGGWMLVRLLTHPEAIPATLLVAAAIAVVIVAKRKAVANLRAGSLERGELLITD